MNQALVQRLVWKDWSFFRRPLSGYCAAGLGSLALLANGSSVAFYVGLVLLVSIVISLGIHLAVATVLHERSEKTMAFVMSLPVSVREYTVAKVAANLGIFLVGWGTIAVGTWVVVLTRPALSNGALPYFTIMLLELLVSFCLLLGVALVSESMGWTVALMVVLNLGFQFVAYAVSHLPAIAAHLDAAEPVWNSTVLTLLGLELLAIPLILGLTLHYQNRKTDFL